MFFKVGGRGKTKLSHNNADEAAPSWGVVRSFFSARRSQQPTSSGRGPGSSSLGPSYCPYSPGCLGGVLCEVELPLYGVLGSSTLWHGPFDPFVLAAPAKG